MTFSQIIKSPQMVASVLSALVVAFGALGIFTTGQSGAITTLLTAVLGVVVAFTHASVSARIAARQATAAVLQDRKAAVTRTSPPAPPIPPISY